MEKDFNRLIKGGCAICGSSGRLGLDRGGKGRARVLCARCSKALGMLERDPDILAAMLAYVRR